jgi:phage N-6-adenine-methyltransferase
MTVPWYSTGMRHKAAFSSRNHDWRTPRALFDALDAEFTFTLDAAASADNALCDEYITEAQDALSQPWTGVAWCNPPYGDGIGKWVAKGLAESRSTAEVVVMLVPARTETAWWHESAMRADEIRLIRGRVSFGGGSQENPESHNAPFPSCLLIFRRHPQNPDGPRFSPTTLPRR